MTWTFEIEGTGKAGLLQNLLHQLANLTKSEL